MDLRCRQAVEPPHSLRHLSTHSWSRPRRAASLHLRATLSRATAQHLSLVSNTDTLTQYTLMLFLQHYEVLAGNTAYVKVTLNQVEMSFWKLVLTEVTDNQLCRNSISRPKSVFTKMCLLNVCQVVQPALLLLWSGRNLHLIRDGQCVSQLPSISWHVAKKPVGGLLPSSN